MSHGQAEGTGHRRVRVRAGILATGSRVGLDLPGGPRRSRWRKYQSEGVKDLSLVAYQFGLHAAPGPLMGSNVVAAALGSMGE